MISATTIEALAAFFCAVLLAVVAMLAAAVLATRKPGNNTSGDISDQFHNEQHKRAMNAPLVKTGATK